MSTGISQPAGLFAHLFALSDGRGLFEHAEYTAPRLEHGYCVDDVARGLVVLARHEDAAPAGDSAAAGGAATGGAVTGAALSDESRLGELAWVYLDFVARSQDGAGRIVNRCDVAGTQHGPFDVEDCWGRAVWGLGTTAARSRDTDRSTAAMTLFSRSVSQRSGHPRAMAFAALGAAEVLAVNPHHGPSLSLLLDTVTLIGPVGIDPAWPWPQPRLSYANAALPEVLLAAGAALDEQSMTEAGLGLLSWLLDTETFQGHLSVTPVGGRGPGDPRPGFDQQPIEVAALADACARAADMTRDPRWADAVLACAGWFVGANDTGVSLYDDQSGGCCDGLTSYGRNDNQGAESTLALISTLQHASRFEAVPA